MRRLKERGFTLIELLVVIAIIGVLSSVVLASLNTARAKARDAQRYSDLHQISTALELYANDHNATYPADTSTVAATDLGTALVPADMPKLPADPTRTGSSGYRYCADASHSVYTLLALTEKANNWCSVSTGKDRCGWSTSYPTPCGK